MKMKSFLKKLNIASNQSEDAEGSNSSPRGTKYSDSSPTKGSVARSSPQGTEYKTGFTGWFNSVTNRNSFNQAQAMSANGGRGGRDEPTDLGPDGLLNIGTDVLSSDSGCSNLRSPDGEEEYQIQVAMELSAREDPEAVQIEAVKQSSLCSCPPEKTPAEILAYRYWNYHSLSYDEKIMDGFYDLYGVITSPTSEKMPSLLDLQVIPVSEGVMWEAVLVNRVSDSNLHKLEQKALSMAIKSRLGPQVSLDGELVQRLAVIVSDHMGGPVGDPENTLKQWQSLSYSLKAEIGSMVLPLGSLKVGLARHRSLLFKVLADSVGLPCRLMKGHQYTGSDSVAMSFVKTEDGREYIVDLMADPGALIPSDAAGSQIECDDSNLSSSLSSNIDYSHVPSSGSGFGSSYASPGDESEEKSQVSVYSTISRAIEDGKVFKVPAYRKEPGWDHTRRSNFPYKHGRSPSWTEGVSSPAVRNMKVKDVSQYMIDAANENPQLAKKLHNVLLESGVVAPANLFAEVLPVDFEVVRVGVKTKEGAHHKNKSQEDRGGLRFLPPLPSHGIQSKARQNVKNVPVAAAAVAAVASSMVVAAVKSNVDATLELPVAAATATAVAMVATSAVVSKQYEHLQNSPFIGGAAASLSQDECTQSDEDSEHHHDILGTNQEGDKVSDKSTGNDSTKSDVLPDDVSDCEIPWDEITVGERIGLGSYGEVYHGDWHGTEVAVKKFLGQDLCGESLEEFKSEVRIMKRLRHPNVVLFMGAVTRAPNLSIVTEFLPRGSLYRLIHRSNNQLDSRRRLRMAYDAARGLNYLHSSSPVIVHRDLKSPNLLVDKNWVVKVCDFGLSRVKQSTYLSSRSAAGTAEWMAPEVLRNEPSDEKCDVFSYGVILWELTTLQQPWGGMNPMQVVGAVGFQHRRLDIPDDVDPVVADIIRKCWQTDPKLRPTFTEIMAALKPLQKPVTRANSANS